MSFEIQGDLALTATPYLRPRKANDSSHELGRPKKQVKKENQSDLGQFIRPIALPPYQLQSQPLQRHTSPPQEQFAKQTAKERALFLERFPLDSSRVQRSPSPLSFFHPPRPRITPSPAPRPTSPFQLEKQEQFAKQPTRESGLFLECFSPDFSRIQQAPSSLSLSPPPRPRITPSPDPSPIYPFHLEEQNSTTEKMV